MTDRLSGRFHRATKSVLVAAAAALLVAFTLPASASSAPPRDECANRVNDTYAMLLECVTVEGVRAHQAAFQRIADASDDAVYPGTRAAGTEGYRDSVDYVAKLLEDAGYRVRLDEFEFEFAFPVVLEQIAPITASYESGSFTGSGTGDVVADVTAVDINLEGDRASTSGCEAADFAGFPAGNIALIQRGTCTFLVKAQNAQDAGAAAVIIFNQGDPGPGDRFGLIVGTLDPFVASIPVVGASFADGSALAQPGSRAHVRVVIETRTDVNVIADLRGDKERNIVMAGAHLDSVPEGPGIQDNGSGAAALLETALMMAKLKPENMLRFAWWGAEESGLIGSTAYVQGLSERERGRLAMYLNYDMVGSPNYVFTVYDADQSTFEAPVVIPPGSTAIEDLYESYYTLIGEPYDDTEFSARSDYQAFIEAGIPSGGLFTGAEEVKTEEQAAIWGGTVGAQFDPCYHLACDTFENINLHALEVNSDLIAFAQLTFAYSTESVNGRVGDRIPGPPVELPPPAGPRGTFEP